MPNYTNTAVWNETVPTIDTTDPLLGGDENAPINVPGRALVQRTSYLKAEVDALGLSAQYGDSSFGPIDGRTITHNLGHTNYVVSVHATEDPNGELGEVWIQYAANSFTIRNTGSFEGGLRWGLTVGTQFGA